MVLNLNAIWIPESPTIWILDKWTPACFLLCRYRIQIIVKYLGHNTINWPFECLYGNDTVRMQIPDTQILKASENWTYPVFQVLFHLNTGLVFRYHLNTAPVLRFFVGHFGSHWKVGLVFRCHSNYAPFEDQTHFYQNKLVILFLRFALCKNDKITNKIISNSTSDYSSFQIPLQVIKCKFKILLNFL